MWLPGADGTNYQAAFPRKKCFGENSMINNEKKIDIDMMNNINSDKILEQWGWNASLDQEFQICKTDGLEAGRVIKEARYIYSIVTKDPLANDDTLYLKGEVSGAFRYKAVVPADYPVIGDWVLFRRGSEESIVIESVFPRKSSFSRKVAGSKTDEQILSTNIDVIFLVFGLNGGRNFTSSGLERYMTLAWDSGATPMIILNKSDLCSKEDRASALLTTKNIAPGVDIHLISAVTQNGFSDLSKTLKPGMTIALTGPSGVGKSTIINSLAGESLQKTTAQREGDLRGRHTTTHKEMFRLPSGVILIDTPV